MYLIRLFLAQLAEFPPSINSHLLCEFANLYGDKLPPHICLVSKESFWLLNEIVKRLERDLQPTQSKPKALPKKITPAIGFNIKRKLRYVGQKFYIKSCWIEIFTWNHVGQKFYIKSCWIEIFIWNHVGQKFYIKSRWTELLHSYILHLQNYISISQSLQLRWIQILRDLVLKTVNVDEFS